MKKLTKSQIEQIAVNKVEYACNKFSRLQAFIGKNDKTPSFDGQIVVKSHPTDKKSDIMAYIDIQVKGTQVTKLTPKEISFSVDVEHIENYLKRDGVMFFVVEIISNAKTRIFYNSLMPFDLNVLLKNCKKCQKEKTIKLKKLDTNKLLNFCNAFAIEKDNQKGITCINSEDLKEFQDFKFPLFYSVNNRIKYFLNNEIYLKAYQKELKRDVILNKVKIISIQQENAMPVAIDGKEYYSHVQIIHKQKEQILKIGESININITNIKNNPPINIKLSGNLYERIQDLEFLLACNEKKLVHIGHNSFEVNPDETLYNQLKEIFKSLQELKTVFEYIGFNFEEDLAVLNQKDKETIDVLVRTIIYKENIIKMSSDIKSLTIEIAGKKIALLVYVENGIQKIFNFFQLHKYFYRTGLSSNDGKEYNIPCYTNSKASDWQMFCNFDIKYCMESIKKCKNSALGLSESIELYLQMLKYYDVTKDENDLNYCDMAIKYLYDNYKNDYSVAVNYYQTIKRQRSLEQSEKNSLRKLRENDALNNLSLLCIAILLDNQSDYEFYYSELSEEERQTFIQWPIYNLVKDKLPAAIEDKEIVKVS